MSGGTAAAVDGSPNSRCRRRNAGAAGAARRQFTDGGEADQPRRLTGNTNGY